MKLLSFFRYYLVAKNKHFVHAPFLFDLYSYILTDSKVDFTAIEQIRSQLCNTYTTIEIDEFGSGSKILKAKNRTISAIAKTSLANKKYAKLHYKLISYIKPKTIIELGTSLGITTLYLAKANPNARVYTFEGSKKIAEIAKKNFINNKNIELIEGDFDEKLLSSLIQKKINIDYVFLDGNHSYKPTMQYFSQLLNFSNENTVFVFDDIHWSDDMEKAWEEIKNHKSVTLSIDLLYVGIIFTSKKLSKEHFVLRY